MGATGRKGMQNARKAKKMTQKQLAEKLGLATGTIQQYELGKRNPSRTTFEKIAEILGVSPMDIVGDGDEVYLSWVEIDNGSRSGGLIPDRTQQTPKEITFNITPDPEWVDLETKLKNGTITPKEWRRYKDLNAIMAENTHSAVEDAKLRLQKIMEQLNDAGQQKVVERAEELTEIPRYRAETAPQSPPAPQEGKVPPHPQPRQKRRQGANRGCSRYGHPLAPKSRGYG
nr:helix-turn-helix domain-containing protein [uncultured Oscillibacter sp.]